MDLDIIRDVVILDKLKTNCAMGMAFDQINGSDPSIHVASYLQAIFYLEEIIENQLDDGRI